MVVALAAVSAVAVGAVFLLNLSGNTEENNNVAELGLRRLTATELSTLSREGLRGDCIAAYKVARHHLYYSFDEAQATHFFRLASKCPNADAHAGLITLLAGKPEFDAEVDESLVELGKLDPRMAKEAAVEVSLRRRERSQH
jgi:hypothetical protein